MKAIETRYKGYRFRSRLEARWAVFFDALKWKWEYEPEAYGDGVTGYLPDFLLDVACGPDPRPPFFVEVKPEDSEHFDAARAIAQWDLLLKTTRRDLIVVFGPPWRTSAISFSAASMGGTPSSLLVCPCCGGPLSFYDAGADDGYGGEFRRRLLEWPAFVSACAAAKAARFEPRR